LYGVLGNGSNSHELLPTLNEDVEAILEEDPENKIVRIDSADEYTVMQMSDGSLYAWGKNDRG
jgi:alpha-tubulin suppressor-like RCC1 family protein